MRILRAIYGNQKAWAAKGISPTLTLTSTLTLTQTLTLSLILTLTHFADMERNGKQRAQTRFGLSMGRKVTQVLTLTLTLTLIEYGSQGDPSSGSNVAEAAIETVFRKFQNTMNRRRVIKERTTADMHHQ